MSIKLFPSITLMITFFLGQNALASYHELKYADPDLPDTVVGMRQISTGMRRAVFVHKDSPEVVKLQHGEDYSLRVQPEVPSPLETISWTHCTGSNPCEVCQGDCDQDTDCAPGLVCMQRISTEPVSGCTGASSHGYDYCVMPELCLDSRNDGTFRPCETPLPDYQKWYFVVVPGERDTFRIQNGALDQCMTKWLDDYDNWDVMIDDDNPGPWQYFKIGRSAFQW